LIPNIDLASPSSITSFQRKTGSLLYTAINTRPNVVFAVSRLARFNTNPSQQHYDAADRVLRYLARTRTLGLQLGGSDTFAVATDASFADNTIDQRSSYAYTVKLFRGVVG